MKKTLFIVAALATLFSSCQKPGNDDDKVGALEATITVSTTLGDLTYAEPVNIEASVSASAALESFSFTAVKKNGEEYTAVGTEQVYEMSGNEICEKFYPDSKEMTDVKVAVKAGGKEAAVYVPVKSVKGEAKGRVYMNDAAQFMADNKVATHDNDPETYPEVNTGAGSDTKSFFSMHGVEVDGKLEHILSLSQLRAVDGLNASFAFVNVLENTKENKVIGSHRGYAFVDIPTLDAGTVGRFCDQYEVDGHKLKDENADKFGMTYVRGSWAGESYHPEVFKFVDSLFTAIGTNNNAYEEMKAFDQLSEIQKKLDNATLGEAEAPTSLGNKNMVRKWLYAGTTAKPTQILEEVFRAGDYIIIRSQRGTVDEPSYYYGIMRILNIYDDSSLFVETDNGLRMDAEKAKELFMKPLYLDIKAQFEI